ncbi:MAG: 3-isopropylmalate dehydratase large subunit [Elusimicrobia bacterium CG1_02_37_114]|nr:MAG: 3-isopropylmalate dehydratase large subunit [Elusimicrobia bacterium CG1_02_37_114]PIV52910.1 MAG: 3-isopropylmalate dehydratase large subunit [Elusimicrobia bacterium CG02_land_8_20_14_3_00_37_13]PIZ13258.1 MAG: 3-isopropylmalate dehydratase large subunit [Elusimicrobia bacterium CG_4_10_14_0_8_um_filter_37_32]
MNHTITEKIIAAHCAPKGEKEVFPGEFVETDVDIALSNDITSPLAIKQFRNIGVKKVFDRNKTVIVLDHFTPNKDIASAEQCKFIRQFAREQNIKYFFDGGNCGIEHALLPEQGIVLPGNLVIGADSHTCTYGALGCFSTGVGSTDIASVWASGKVWLKIPETIKFIYEGKKNKWVYGKDLILYTIGKIGVDGANYKAMEFTGSVIRKLPMTERLTMCNMSIEAGAKSGIVEPDEITMEFVRRTKSGRNLKSKFMGQWLDLKSDRAVDYCNLVEINVSKIEPQVALPHLPSNTKPVSKLGTILVDQVVIGSCTNGFLEDMRIAAGILKGKKVHKYVRLLIFPATPEIYRQSLKEGLIDIFIDSGGIVNPPTCGPCLGGHSGVLAKGEKCISTTNRNFCGRMGHLESEVYLSNPAIAAASAIAGRITGVR